MPRIPPMGANKYEAKVPPNKNFSVDLYMDHSTAQYRMRLSGMAAGLTSNARTAIEYVLAQYVAPVGSARERITRPMRTAVEVKRMVSEALMRSAGMGLNEMADDKAWPLFWATFHSAQRPDARWGVYNRETAGDVVKQFKASHDLSNADWKWLCAQDQFYLFSFYNSPPPYNIRLPREYVCENDIAGAISAPAFRHLLPWFRDQLKKDDHGFPASATFRHALSDYRDVLNEETPEEQARLLRSRNWQEFFNRIQEMEQARGRRFQGQRGYVAYRPLQGFSPARMAMADMDDIYALLAQRLGVEHIMRERSGRDPIFTGRDQAAANTATEIVAMRQQMWERARRLMEAERAVDPPMIVEGRQSINANEITNRALEGLAAFGSSAQLIPKVNPQVALDWMAQLPKQGAVGKVQYRLLDTIGKVLDEGQRMSHCLGRLYAAHIAMGTYIAYHLSYVNEDGTSHPEKDRGFTLGFHRASPTRLQDYVVHDEIAFSTRIDKSGNRHVVKPIVIDQIRGYKNAVPNDRALDLCADYLLKEINKLVKE